MERLKVPQLELDADKSRLTNQTFRVSRTVHRGHDERHSHISAYCCPSTFQRVIATTCRYQRSVSVEGCTELTKEVFPLLAECAHLRDVNLSATVCNDLAFLRVSTTPRAMGGPGGRAAG